MFEEDLAMRAVLDNAELLVFTSTVLPKQFQRFQTNLYLWGAFRGKQSTASKKDCNPGAENDSTKPLTGVSEFSISNHRMAPKRSLEVRSLLPLSKKSKKFDNPQVEKPFFPERNIDMSAHKSEAIRHLIKFVSTKSLRHLALDNSGLTQNQ